MTNVKIRNPGSMSREDSKALISLSKQNLSKRWSEVMEGCPQSISGSCPSTGHCNSRGASSVLDKDASQMGRLAQVQVKADDFAMSGYGAFSSAFQGPSKCQCTWHTLIKMATKVRLATWKKIILAATRSEYKEGSSGD